MLLHTKPLQSHTKLLISLIFIAAVCVASLILRVKNAEGTEAEHENGNENKAQDYEDSTNATANTSSKTGRKEYLYRLLTNTTRSLIQMEIKARRLEENMRRIKEKTADLLWKNKDEALWEILFKNITKHITLRHEFHQHSSLKRIMEYSHSHKYKHHNHKTERRKFDQSSKLLNILQPSLQR